MNDKLHVRVQLIRNPQRYSCILVQRENLASTYARYVSINRVITYMTCTRLSLKYPVNVMSLLVCPFLVPNANMLAYTVCKPRSPFMRG